MKIIISPAKKLTNHNISISNPSTIHFYEETKYLVDQLRNYTVADFKNIMSLSDNLAKLNFDRYQQWDLTSKKVNPAIFIFQGDVYKGLRAEDFSESELNFAQVNLRIISGLYGIVKPLDLIFPYRLEMGTHIETNFGSNLYEFWGEKLNHFLSSEMEPNDTLVNLASNEYSKSLKLESMPQKIVTPVFKDYKNGKLKVISFFAKKARGEMANFIIKNRISNSEDLKLFTNNGYVFSEHNNGEMIFTR